jgi:acetoin utilization deacetylase AcuC-like enzyme
MPAILLTHPDCLIHEMPRHPERPDRLRSVLATLNERGLSGDMNQGLASEISLDLIEQVHPRSYIDDVLAFEPIDGVAKFEPDTYMNNGSSRAARLSAGAVAEATSRVLAGESHRAFCAIRPPGHHAEIAAAFGFCLFNNVAIGARVALQDPSIKRVAILDFDVHHCNGTVDIFKDDPRVMVCSSFQDDFYPHRFLDYENEHIINTPLAAGTSGHQYRSLIESTWLRQIESHKPDLIFVSAGFDAHRDDPLAEIQLIEDDYRWITEMIISLAENHSQGRIVSTLEGGYHLQALGNSAAPHVAALIA